MSLLSSIQADAPLFSDGLGERVVAADRSTGRLLQVLRVAPRLAASPGVEPALRERFARVATFRSPMYARVRSIERMPSAGGLALVSDHVEGVRLSEILRIGHERGIELDPTTALSLIRQLAAAVAFLHARGPDLSHGCLAPERILVTADGRVTIVEHVAGSALESLQYGRARLWQEFRVALPASAGSARFDHRADVHALGVIALALVLGRPLAADEFPHSIPRLLLQACDRAGVAHQHRVSSPLGICLARMLQLELRNAFASAPAALAALEELADGDAAYGPAPAAIPTFVSLRLANVLRASADAAGTRGSGVPQDTRGAHPPARPERSTSDAGQAQAAERSRDGMDGHVQTVPALERAPEAADGSGESGDRPGTPGNIVGRRRPPRWCVAVACALLAAGATVYGARALDVGPGRGTGTVSVYSNPAGVEVFVDGLPRGLTPATVVVPAGSHILELRGRGVPMVVPLNLHAGARVSRYLEVNHVADTGMLVVHSDPTGATVIVDGVARGTTPLTLDGLSAGDHVVVLRNAWDISRHLVKVVAGKTASLAAPVAGARSIGEPVPGWVSIDAPFTVEIREDGELIATSDTGRVMLASGRHILELVNPTLGLRQLHAVKVLPGKVAAIGLELPHGVVSVNAAPWAEVWIDGRRVGETPIGDLQVPIGAHEILFRHPQLGEKRHAVSVTTAAPVRLSVSMR